VIVQKDILKLVIFFYVKLHLELPGVYSQRIGVKMGDRRNLDGKENDVWLWGAPEAFLWITV